MKLPFKLQWLLVQWRMERLINKTPITSFDLLQVSIDMTKLIIKTDDQTMLADWLKHSLLPALAEVKEWAEEITDEQNTGDKKS